SFIFFFQAEDGIRDFHVTGVQTCALPILPERDVVRGGCSASATTSRSGTRSRSTAVASRAFPAATRAPRASTPEARRTSRSPERSEERRVGKGWGGGGGGGHGRVETVRKR